MRTIEHQELEKVAGGWTSTSSQISQSLSSINSTLSNLNSNQYNNQSSYLLPMVMALALQNRNRSVVSAGGATVVA